MLGQFPRRFPAVGPKLAGHALVESPLAYRRDVVWDHAARDLEAAAEALLQHFDVADAVLETDDGCPLATMLRDLLRRRHRVAALDAQGDHRGFVERFRPAAIVDVAWRQVHPPAAVIGERQSVLVDLAG